MIRLLVWLVLAYLVYRFVKALVLELTGGKQHFPGHIRKGKRNIDSIPDADFEEIREDKESNDSKR
jgi:hypothetical protein